MSFATPADLSSILRRTFDSGMTTSAQLLLDLATAAITNYTRQTLTLVTNDVVPLHGNWSHELILPERPVTAVTVVAIGTGIAAETLIQDTDWNWPGKDVVIRGAKIPAKVREEWDRADDWGGPNMTVTVTYTHGLATIPNDLRGVCLSAAARAYVNPDGIMLEHIGGYQVRYPLPGDSTGVVLTDAEKTQLNRYRRRP